MNAPSKILTDPIDCFLPGCAGEERRIRERLLKARDLASSRVRSAKSDQARALFWLIVTDASAWAFASAPNDHLTDVANNCVRLFMCASFAERREAGE